MCNKCFVPEDADVRLTKDSCGKYMITFEGMQPLKRITGVENYFYKLCVSTFHDQNAVYLCEGYRAEI